jgi:hypothetical protein
LGSLGHVVHDDARLPAKTRSSNAAQARRRRVMEVRRPYLDQVGDAQRMPSRLHDASRTLLASIATPEGPLQSHVDQWVAAALEIGRLDERRAQLEAEGDPGQLVAPDGLPEGDPGQLVAPDGLPEGDPGQLAVSAPLREGITSQIVSLALLAEGITEQPGAADAPLGRHHGATGCR